MLPEVRRTDTLHPGDCALALVGGLQAMRCLTHLYTIDRWKRTATLTILEVQMSGLDEVSQRAVEGCAIRGCMMTVFVFLPWVLGLIPFVEAFRNITPVFVTAALIAMLLAVLRHQHAAKGSLNSWDESLVFNGFAMLAHIIARLHP